MQQTAEPTTSEPVRRTLPHWRIDATVLGVVALLLRLPAFFTDKSLVFDDAVFAASAYAMRAGEAPFKTVFSSQGPMFLPGMICWRISPLSGALTTISGKIAVCPDVSMMALTVRQGEERGSIIGSINGWEGGDECTQRGDGGKSHPAAQSSHGGRVIRHPVDRAVPGRITIA